MRRFPGVTYTFGGMPLTDTDRRAQRHLDDRDGILCPRGCAICDWAKRWAAQQATLRLR